VDSAEQTVGPVFITGLEDVNVTLPTPGRRISVRATSTGISRALAGVTLYYESSDCTGTPRWYYAGSDLGAQADGNFIGTFSHYVFYARQPVVWGVMHSQKRWVSGDPLTDPASCVAEDSGTNNWGVAELYRLPSYVPPFHIE
jgi:hypothetical protein